jgi:hypothetical protein
MCKHFFVKVRFVDSYSWTVGSERIASPSDFLSEERVSEVHAITACTLEMFWMRLSYDLSLFTP